MGFKLTTFWTCENNWQGKQSALNDQEFVRMLSKGSFSEFVLLTVRIGLDLIQINLTLLDLNL